MCVYYDIEVKRMHVDNRCHHLLVEALIKSIVNDALFKNITNAVLGTKDFISLVTISLFILMTWTKNEITMPPLHYTYFKAYYIHTKLIVQKHLFWWFCCFLYIVMVAILYFENATFVTLHGIYLWSELTSNWKHGWQHEYGNGSHYL